MTDAARVIEFSIPTVTPSLNEWQRWHWSKKRKCTKQLCAFVAIATMGMRNAPPIEKCSLKFTRVGRNKLDYDNLYGGLKPLIDCLVVVSRTHPFGLGLIVDDDQEHVAGLTASSIIVADGGVMTSVRIEAVE